MDDRHDTVVIPRAIVIRIDFQALTDLVAYLNTNQQMTVDAITAQVQQLTGRVQTVRTKMDAVVAKNL